MQTVDGVVVDSDRASALLKPRDVAVDPVFGIPETTQAVWRSTNRYGFRELVIKVGSGVRYRRGELERWLESRRQCLPG